MKLRELCAEKHLSIMARKKEELIVTLMVAKRAEPESDKMLDPHLLSCLS